MGFFDFFAKGKELPTESKGQVPPKPAPKKRASKKKSEKELCTERGEPYVNIISMELDEGDVANGAFELDWNEFFIAKLIKAGYVGRNDEQIVDQWFQNVCRNIVLETYEQYEANDPRPTSATQRKDLGNGKSEFS